MKQNVLASIALFFFGFISISRPAVPETNAPTVVEKGLDYRVWSETSLRTNSAGLVRLATNSYTELATGLHRIENGELVEASPEIELFPPGGAIARKTRHQVIFSGNANDWNGAIQLEAGNERFRSRVLGVAYFDNATGNSVMLAELKDSIGVINPPNRVIYPDCMTDLKCDLEYINTLAGLQQNLVFKENPPAPSTFGLNNDTTFLQLLTEWFEAPVPAKTSMLHEGLIDDRVLKFSAVRIVPGKSFISGEESRSVTVGKQWKKLSGRDFLIEQVPYRCVQDFLETMPQAPQVNLRTPEERQRLVGRTLQLPERKLATAPLSEAMKVAQTPITREGFVLDYSILNEGTLTNHVFQADTTYLITGLVGLDGISTFEGGAVLKYSEGQALRIDGTILCKTDAYRPAVFTHWQDDSVGAKIYGSTNNPFSSSIGMMVANYSYNMELKHLRFSYLDYSIDFGAREVTNTLSHCQFIKGSSILFDWGIVAQKLRLFNALFYQSGIIGHEEITIHGEHLTMNQSSINCGTLQLTNTLLVAVTNLYANDANPTNSNFIWLTNDPGVFQIVGTAAHYLTNNSPYRNVGTTNIHPDLLVQLRNKTTYPPTVITTNITGNLVLSTNAPRDSDGNLDIGFQYDPLDYAIQPQTLTNVTLTLTNGSAIAFYRTGAGSSGVALKGSTVISEGTPVALNQFTWFNTVHEGAATNWTGASGLFFIAPFTETCSLRCRFTRFSSLSAVTASVYLSDPAEDFGNGMTGTFQFHNCQFHAGAIKVWSGAGGASLTLTNCVFDRTELGTVWFQGSSSNSLTATACNNLFRENRFSSLGGVYSFSDNLFDKTAISQNGAFTHSNNAYLTNENSLTPLGLTDVVLTNNSFPYATGVLGHFYHGVTNLADKGSQTAAVAGLYHFTTTTNQVKETNSAVDIGFHYVATDGTGIPISTYWTGLPDYQFDQNGDGALGIWLTDYFGSLGVNPNDDPDGDWITNLQEYQTGSIPADPIVIAWGENAQAQCDVPLNLRNVTSVSGGYDHSIALCSDGSVVAWGDNAQGQTDVPLNLTNAVAAAAGFYHSIAIEADGTVSAWGKWYDGDFQIISVPSSATNLAAISAGADHDIGLSSNGTVIVWGFTNRAYNTVLPNLSNVTAVAAGWNHNAVLLNDGMVRAWGDNFSALNWNVTNVPTDLSNVVQLAAGAYHTVALKSDGTVVAWGAGNSTNGLWWADWGQSIVPEGLSNVVAIAAGGYHSLALLANGSVVSWGDMEIPGWLEDSLISIDSGVQHDLAVRGGRLTPWVVQQPANQFAPAGSNVTFTAQGIGLAGVLYQWQFNGVNIPGATTSALALSNVQASDEGDYQVIISTGAGSVTSSSATFTLVRPPDVVSTLPSVPSTNWVTTNIVLRVSATAAGTNIYPISYEWKRNGILLTNIYTNAAGNEFTLNWPTVLSATNLDGDYSVSVTNIAGVTNVGNWRIRAFYPGMVGGWGANDDGQLERPPDLTNTIALAAGEFHSVAVNEDGRVMQWGYNWGSIPNDATNVVAVSAGYEHTLAVRGDGTVVAWGDLNGAANYVPTNLPPVSAVAAGWNHNVALLTDGTVTAWGTNGAALGWHLTEVPISATNVISVSAGALHSLALQSNGTIIAWGYNNAGQTNVPSSATNVVAIAAGGEHNLALKSDGTVIGWGANSHGQCDVPNGLSNVMAVAAGWAHSVALKNDGTLVAWGDNSNGQTNIPSALNGEIKLLAVRGDHTLISCFSRITSYAVDPAKDLLLIYNTNSVDSTWVKDYYLAHRPMVSGANVLGIGCTTNEAIQPEYFMNLIAPSVQNWLSANPTKRPGYVILFPDIPSQIVTNDWSSVCGWGDDRGWRPSVQYQLHTFFSSRFAPCVTSINMGETNACRAYIDKLQSFGTNYSPGQILISARMGGYGNTNYYFDDASSGYSYMPGQEARDSVIQNGIQSSTVTYVSRSQQHITNASSVAAYMTWGANGGQGADYSTDGSVVFSGSSGWYIIKTIESFNGQRCDPGQGTFLKWFSSNAFGGTNYSNVPVGAVTHVLEPGYFGVSDSSKYYGLWVRNKNFGICAWNSTNTGVFQAVGDPFVMR